MTPRSICALLALTLFLAAAVPASAQPRRGWRDRDDAFRVHFGAFQPDGESEYWEDKARQFTGDADDFENLEVGADYWLGLSRRLSLAFSGTLFQGDATQSYLDFQDNFGDRIRHETTLDLASASLGLVFHFTGPDAVVNPYVGAGGGAWFWQLEEAGDFIDFGRPTRPVFSATLESSGTAFGYYGLAGLAVPVTPRLSVFAEGRWTQVEDELEDDFEGFGDLDLSGRVFSAGLSWRL